ncbi:hypothetical protein PFFCH_05540, partial [Plasmodium falciparum FCH/4]
MGGGNGGGGSPQEQEDKYKDAKDAKELLDRIGEEVYKEKVKNAANVFRDYLKGDLNKANNASDETISSLDPCNSDYTTRLNGKRHPCDKRSPVRFSDEYGGQCTFNRIKDNETDDNKCGACAPYRRLHLCDYNLEKMDSTKIKDKNVLLAEVCYAAKYEGESLKTYREQYDATYPGSGSTMCTMLARSFADIGDIIRGRDLYSGNKKEKKQREQLENKLKDIFKNIYNELTNGRNGVKERYKDTDNYYELREDWWTANRDQVWKAITCGTHEGDTYFRPTCSDSERSGTFSQANKYCRCNDDKPNADKPNTDPPTYFDYVPQFLRWFEEWGEDFCRKKKKKLENVQKQCRGEYQGEERYCSRNGYDCEKTKRAIGKYRMGNQCTKCLFACNPYVEWIDNQRKQFDKQKKKYDEEIKKYENGASSSRRQKGGTNITNYEGYEKKFYEELKDKYGTVDAFLGLLSKEKTCTAVKDTEGGKIDFKQVNSGSASDS